MGDEAQHRRQQYAEALRTLCKNRGIPASGYSLAAVLQTAGCYLHPNTLKEQLAGKRLPRATTVEQILSALSASADERALLLSFTSTPADSDIVVMRDALLQGLDVGRVSNEVTWVYTIGLSDDKDECTEERLTTVGPEGTESLSFSIGQIGGLKFGLLDLAQIDLHVVAERFTDRRMWEATPVSWQVFELEPRASKYRIAVRFSETLRNEKVRWAVHYRWPGLWRSLRETGEGSGRVGTSGRSQWPKGTVVLKAPRDAFDDLELLPQPADMGTLADLSDKENIGIGWTVSAPPEAMRFEVRSDCHRQR